MGSNVQADNNGDILVDFDYNNIIVVDPNKTIKNGKISERLVDHENLVMYANLEAEVIPRTKLSVGGVPTDRIRTISVAKMNFLKPTKNSYLGSGYIDELTGKNSTKYQGINQPKEIVHDAKNDGKAYYENTVADQSNILDNGLLGITSISIRTNTSFIPSVSIKLEDVQGKALFQLGNNSPYAAFFNLPYCPFYLTLKGYYGQAIRYQLNLEKFNAGFNASTGNYTVDLEFKGYKFNILNEISVGHLMAAPHMYSQTFSITQSPVEGQPNNSNRAITQNPNTKQGTTSTDNVVSQVVTEKGYQKVIEVYSEYKSKLLIPPDFPELTLVQLMNKLEMFEQSIANSYPKVNVEPLTNIRNYKQKIKEYFNAVRGSQTSWFNRFLDLKPVVLKEGQQKVYFFKENLSENEKAGAEAELVKIIKEYNDVLSENPTLGTKKGKFPIKNDITYDMTRINVTPGEIDFKQSITERTGNLAPTTADTQNFVTTLSKIFKVQLSVEFKGNIPVPKDVVLPKFFIFEGQKRYDKTIADIEAQANKVLSETEDALSADLARKIEDKSTGIGFKPTVRNIMAVIMASAEAFIRLLDDVHTNAWNVKYDPVRKSAILDNPSSAQGSDTKDDVKISQSAQQDNNGLSTAQIPVYPWPQFFVETPEDKKGRFQLKYIADPSVVNLTKGYLYDKWPEVEFVEEYMRGLTQKLNPPISQPPIGGDLNTFITNINAIEFPNSGIAYVNKEEIKFFYEIWERQYLTSFYSGFLRVYTNNQQTDELKKINDVIEAQNIIKSLGGSSPYLSLKLKNYNINSANYTEFLNNISNQGTGRAYQDFIRDFFVTPYIKSITENSFSILPLNNLGKIPESPVDFKKLENITKSVTNQPLIIDTFPFTNPNWNTENMSDSSKNEDDLVYNTSKVLRVFESRNVIANFNNINDYTTNRPVTNFSYLSVKNPLDYLNTQSLVDFYDNREPKDFVPTESYCTYDSPNTNFPTKTTTSILNTPYFINAILNGVNEWRRSSKYPYVQAAYLFLNSLPLASLRERYRTLNTVNDLDYIASCFKKFGAIHKMPYAWVLKLGSIWHRYKTFKESGVDIISTCWNKFDYLNGYDPISKDSSKLYKFNLKDTNPQGTQEDKQYSIVLQNIQTDAITISTGFYPKVISDFNVFYNGYDLYKDYTDSEIQTSINNGMKVSQNTNSNITGNQNNTTINVFNFSVMLPDLIPNTFNSDNTCAPPSNNTTSLEYYVVPSFGSLGNQTLNQTESECMIAGQTLVNLTNNQSMYNGSVRLLWSAPNYGYFDETQIRKPSPDSYVNKIDSTLSEQSPMELLNTNEYTKIEEIFSVFSKNILNQFEQEFLNFSKPLTDIEYSTKTLGIGISSLDTSLAFKNFQYLFKTLMTVPGQKYGTSFQQYFDDSMTNQASVFATTIKSFMEFDVILKNGNPSNYNRRLFASFLGTTTNPITFQPYVQNSLPSLKSTITLSESRNKYPKEWIVLETEVGFSTIPNLSYSDRGSYITDFFIDNNIAFTVDNITLLSQLIKIYATQKLKDVTLNNTKFKTLLNQYETSGNNVQNILLNGVLSKVRAGLPNQQQLPERTIKSVIDGEQSKVESYEVFKALNDKWVAGSDFKTKTLFEDILFLDRASRNIGDIIILDIFDLKNMINKNSLNERMSVFTLMSGILIKNNFTVMPLPAYVNFYNVQDADGITTQNATEGSLEFANNMWGTFLNVDYRKSGPKMVCFYVGKPSSYLDLPKGNMRYRDDSFEMRRASENPLIENQVDKKDWALSNKCVGFNVDIGTRNQNVFYGFQVGMEGGKATSETIQTQLNMVDQASGRDVATQNNSLYNLYKQRSYTCTISCFGNAMLQPTMYFNLRHVPMFNGPYMITDVSHTVGPGNFETTVTGVRQGIFDLPAIDSFLQSINKNLLTKIEALVITKKDEPNNPTISTTNSGKSSAVIQSAGSTIGAENSCTSKVNQFYLDRQWDVTKAVLTSLNEKEMKDAIVKSINNEILQTIIYCICYIRTYEGAVFNGWNNNFATLTIDDSYGDPALTYFTKKYSCLNLGKAESKNPNTQPIANFESVEKFIQFMGSRLLERVPQITSIGLKKYYVCEWPKSNVSFDYYEQNKNEFTTVFETLEKALKSATKLGLADLQGNKIVVNPPVQPTPTPSPTKGTIAPTPTASPVAINCYPPTVASFSPTSGVFNTILTVRGYNLQSTTAVTINNILVTTGINRSLDGTQLTVSVPNSPTGIEERSNIIVRTTNGNAMSPELFTYNPQETEIPNSLPPDIPANVDTQPQQTGLEVLISSITSNGNLIVQVASGFGVWKIDKIPTYIYTITKQSPGPNNTINDEIVQTNNSNFTELPNTNYVSSNQQTFTISSTEFLLNVLNLTSNQTDNYKGAKVKVIFNVIGIPEDRVKYPQNILTSAEYSFTIN